MKTLLIMKKYGPDEEEMCYPVSWLICTVNSKEEKFKQMSSQWNYNREMSKQVHTSHWN
jgi:hypothetical protein